MMLKHVLPGCLTPQRHAAVPRTAETPCQPGSRSGGQVYTGVWVQVYTGVHWGVGLDVHWGTLGCGVRRTLGYTGVWG